MNLSTFLLPLLILLSSFCFPLQTVFAGKVVRILSIEGDIKEGVERVIPARILEYIEEKLQTKLSERKIKVAERFDVITGTPANGLIILDLSIPNENREPKNSAKDIATLYQQEEIFPSTTKLWRRFISLFKRGCGKKSLMDILEEYFGDVELKDALSHVIIPTP